MLLLSRFSSWFVSFLSSSSRLSACDRLPPCLPLFSSLSLVTASDLQQPSTENEYQLQRLVLNKWLNSESGLRIKQWNYSELEEKDDRRENRSERWMEEGGCRVSGCVDVLMCGYEVLWPSVRTWISDLVTPSVFASLSCCFSPLVCWMVTCCSQTSFYTLLFISFYILSRDGLFNMQSI